MKGVFRYYASKELGEIIKQLMNDVNCKIKKDFLLDLINGKTFEIRLNKLEVSHNQSVEIKPNAYQLNTMHKLLMSKISEGQKNLQNTLSVSDYKDTDKLIADMHLDRSEIVETKDIKNLKYTSSGEIGLTPLSPQFADCYLKILSNDLFYFDREIALPKVTVLNEDDHYMVDLQDRIKLIPELTIKGNYGDKGLVGFTPELDNIELINEKVNVFKNTLDIEAASIDKTNQKIVSVLMETVNELDGIHENRKTVAYAIAQIHQSMNEINKKNNSKKTNSDYLLHLLQNIKVQVHTIEESNAKIIEQVKDNLAILNKHIADYNYEIYKNNLTGKEQLKQIVRVMNTLRITAINNHNLINSFIG